MHKLRTLCAGLALSISGIAFAQTAPIVVGFERLYEADQKSTAQQGRVLLGELGCTACHDAGQTLNINHKQGPILENIGSRINPDYLIKWLQKPHDMKPGTTMPDLLAHAAPPARDMAANFLTQFLMSRGEAFIPDTTKLDPKSIARGDNLFHTVGCVACHAPQHKANTLIDSDNSEDVPAVSHVAPKIPSVPLPDLRAKTNHQSLTQFLLDPHRVRSSGRMPNLNLTAEEANDIASYLRAPTQASIPSPTTEFKRNDYAVQKGKELYTLFGCIACHDQEKWKRDTPLFKAESIGCLAEKPFNLVPFYNLDDRQRAAIKLAIANPLPPTPASTLQDKIAALNCYACHERDGIGGIELGRNDYFNATAEYDLGDEGRIPPTLTGVGAKLTEKGLTDILLNHHQGSNSVRPYMATRMPHFGEAQVGDFAQAFLAVDKNEKPFPINVTGLEHNHRNRYGRELMGTEGLGCIACHGLQGNKSLGIPAIDLATSPERLQPSWFMEYLHDPASLRPGTRMPAFFEDGKSQHKLFGGNANKQIEAIWIYLRELDQTRLPIGMEKTDNFKMVPTDRPILLRTFMKDVGSQVITVGNPEGIHFAFDSRHSRVALAWRGEYIDAESAMADRFNPFVTPLSDDRYTLPAGMPITALADAKAPWPEAVGEDAGFTFKGYRLSATGTPTFLYTLTAGEETISIEETILATSKKTLLRRFVITGNVKTPLYIRRHEDGKSFRAVVTPSTTSTTVDWTLSW